VRLAHVQETGGKAMDPNPGQTHDPATTHTKTPTAATTATTTERHVQQNEPYEAGAVDVDRGEKGLVHRVAGGAIWSGLAIGLAVWVLLELALAAIDLVPLGLSGSGYETSELWWTGAASVIALFIGGLVAGAGGYSRDAIDGALQGIVTWGATVLGIVVLVAIGAGIGFGAFGESIINAETQSTISPEQQQQAEEQGFVLTQDEAEESAGVATLFLGLTVAAAAIGGVLGAAMSASNEDRIRVRVRARTR
jgi:uncharacterized protein HemX